MYNSKNDMLEAFMQVMVTIPDDQMPILSDMMPRLGVKDQEGIISYAINELIERYYNNPLGRGFGILRGKGITAEKIREAWYTNASENSI